MFCTPMITIVDSQIAKLKNIDVQEMTNGCLCCVLVGQMKEGLLELKAKYSPDRIIIETSGSAFPGMYYHHANSTPRESKYKKMPCANKAVNGIYRTHCMADPGIG